MRVVDLSSRGCKLRTTEPMWTGDQISLSVPNKGALDCTVRWSRNGFVGIEFNPEPASVGNKTVMPRENVRFETSAEVRIRRIGGSNFNVALLDLSLDGCRVELIERVRLGEDIQIVFPSLSTIQAKVRWVNGFIAGLRFEKSFHPAVFDLLIERLRGS